MRGTIVSTARGAFAYSASKVLLTYTSPAIVSGWTACPWSTRKQRFGQSMMSSSRGNQEDNNVVCKSTTDNDNTESIRLESEMEMQQVASLLSSCLTCPYRDLPIDLSSSSTYSPVSLSSAGRTGSLVFSLLDTDHPPETTTETPFLYTPLLESKMFLKIMGLLSHKIDTVLVCLPIIPV